MRKPSRSHHGGSRNRGLVFFEAVWRRLQVTCAASVDSRLCSVRTEILGRIKGSSTLTGLAFEDGTGTLRFLNNIPCNGIPAVTLEIRRTVGNTSDGGNQ